MFLQIKEPRRRLGGWGGGWKAILDHNKDGEISLDVVLDWSYVDRRAANQPRRLWGLAVRTAERGLRLNATEVTPPLLPKSFEFFGLPSLVLVSRARLTFSLRTYAGRRGVPSLLSFLPAPSHPLVPWSSLFVRWHALYYSLAHSNRLIAGVGSCTGRLNSFFRNTCSWTPPPFLALLYSLYRWKMDWSCLHGYSDLDYLFIFIYLFCWCRLLIPYPHLSDILLRHREYGGEGVLAW